MDTPPIPFPESGAEDLTHVASVGVDAASPDNPPWGIPGAFGVWVTSFVFMFVTQFVFVIGYLLYQYGVAGFARAAANIMQDPVAVFMAILSIIPAHVLTLGLAWLLVTKAGKRPFLSTLGWEWGGFGFWRCAGLAVLLLVTAFSIIWKLTDNPQTELDRLIESSRAAALTTAFLATVTAPLVEEVVYRGVLYSSLRRAIGMRWAVAVVIFLFAAIHVPQYWPNFGVIGTILALSIVLTTLRARTGQLLPCFVVHLVFNGIQSLLIVLDPYVRHLTPEQTPAPVPPPAPGALLHALVQLLHLHL